MAHDVCATVFFGDEICCSNVTCWETSLAPVAKKVRKLLPDAVIYTNECAEKGIKEVPPDFDLISVDTCSSLFSAASALTRSELEFLRPHHVMCLKTN